MDIVFESFTAAGGGAGHLRARPVRVMARAVADAAALISAPSQVKATGYQLQGGDSHLALPAASMLAKAGAGALGRLRLTPTELFATPGSLVPSVALASLSLPVPYVQARGHQQMTGEARLAGHSRILAAPVSATGQLVARPSRVFAIAAGPIRKQALLVQPLAMTVQVDPVPTHNLADGFQASEQTNTDLIHALLDLMTGSDSYSVVAEALQALADGASLADVAQMIIAADLLDSFIASVVQDGTAQLTVLLADGLQAGDSATALSEILAALADGFYATLTIATGEDVWTAWVMTTQTKAMRRYTNWAFNSYAMLGGAFLGAGPAGIYRMGGTSDAGEAIRWAIRTGKLNFGSDAMKGAPLVYIGATTSGDLLLRVRATTVRGEEIEQTYRMTPATTGARREHRVPVGRGFRSVYWTFEIASDVDGATAEIDEWHAVPVKHTGKPI